MARILVVDDDPFIRSAHLRNLQRLGYDVLDVEDGRSAIGLLLDAAPDRPAHAVLLDYMLPGMDGLATFAALRDALGEDCPPVIMITGQGSTHLAVEFMKAGGADFMEKPVTDYAILDIRVQRAMENARTERMRREEVVARKTAQASDRLKDEFLALAARELRDPLRGIMASAACLSGKAHGGECADPDEALRLAASISDVARVVDDLLELTELDSLAPIVLMPTDLCSVLSGIEPVARQAAEGRRLALRWSVPPDIPRIMANPAKLGEVVRKLLDNAVKFTDEGFVELRAESDGADVLLSVRDTGLGIAPGDQKRIFGRFSKLDPGRATPGAGVGLYIAKRLCERMNVPLRLESTPGRGSIFFLSLPVSG